MRGEGCLYSDHHAGVLVPAQKGVLAAPRLGVGDVGPGAHEVLVRRDAGEAAGDGAVHGLHDAEVGGEEDVEVALVDLRRIWVVNNALFPGLELGWVRGCVDLREAWRRAPCAAGTASGRRGC